MVFFIFIQILIEHSVSKQCRPWSVSCVCISSYSLIPIHLKLYMCLGHGLKMCILILRRLVWVFSVCLCPTKKDARPIWVKVAIMILTLFEEMIFLQKNSIFIVRFYASSENFSMIIFIKFR